MRTVRNSSRLLGGPGGVPGMGGVPGPEGYLARHSPPGPGPGGYLPRYSPRGQTDTCKNITFATSLRTVIIILKFDNILDIWTTGT